MNHAPLYNRLFENYKRVQSPVHPRSQSYILYSFKEIPQAQETFLRREIAQSGSPILNQGPHIPSCPFASLVAAIAPQIQVMSLLKNHPNVVTLEGVFEDKAGVHIVMELCTGGSLTEHVCSQASGNAMLSGYAHACDEGRIPEP